jgi:NAD(P)-dependent dehydrogenase (short-subunit alcohol dehydrogenase family)
MNSLFSLENRVAIVSGAGRGTGRAIALMLAQAGADLAVAARTLEQLEETASEVRKLGRRVVAVQTDVRDREQVSNLVKRALEEFGRIDILVNNAGAGSVVETLNTSENRFDSLIKTNLRAGFFCSQAVAETMKKQGKGSIINIASTEGLRAAPTNGIYGAAKAGVIALTKTLASELGEFHIRVNAVAPGFIETAFPASMEIPKLRELFGRVPLGRAVKCEEIAAAVLYFASDASDCTSGAVLVVDGGMASRLG